MLVFDLQTLSKTPEIFNPFCTTYYKTLCFMGRKISVHVALAFDYHCSTMVMELRWNGEVW